jgi:hypothetical protein
MSAGISGFARILSAADPASTPWFARPATRARYSVTRRCESEAFMAFTFDSNLVMHL